MLIFSTLDSFGGGNGSTQFVVKKLTNSNYKYWRLCMKVFLQGEDLWDLVSNVDLAASDVPKNDIH